MTETNPLAFFESVYDAYQRAEQTVGGPIYRYYNIGGYIVRLRFAGPVLVPFITPALEHLAAPPDITRADLTICLWDSLSTTTSMPSRPWEQNDSFVPKEARGFSNARVHTAMSRDVGAVSLLDKTENLGVYWIRDACPVPTHERGAPLRSILHWWMRQHGYFLIHAAAVGRQEGGVLLVGRGGSGKSTSALASQVSGWRYVSDDYCLLTANELPYVYSLYNSAKLNASHLKKFPTLLPAISNLEELTSEKALIYFYQHQPTCLISGFPIRAILLPRVTGRLETVVTPAAPMAALQALAPSSLFQLPGAGQSELLALADLVRKVPCYHLELGTELEQIPDTIMKVMHQ